ncbi:MAG: hypothetical protein HQL03_04375 [Nitrospirae bacterium]|nr:hypothetical protein [Nitrospirota bacterium]
MNGATITGGGAVATVADPAWQIKGVGDFDGDGNTGDILWQNTTTGQVVIWDMFGPAIVGVGSPATVADPSWQIKLNITQ